MFWLSKTCCPIHNMRIMNHCLIAKETLWHNVFWGIMVRISNADMFWMSKTWIFGLVEKFYN
jgi:hypothetical protein